MNPKLRCRAIVDPHGRHVSLSNIPALPTEILSKIFHHCTDWDGSLTPVNTIDIPLLLTQICSSWRKVAIGTQSLWSRLFLNIKPNAIHQTSLTSTWLTRSGAYPLQIYIIWETPPFHASHAVLDILVQHSYHWKRMFFFIPFIAYGSLASIRGNLPLLTDLSLGTYDDMASDPVSDVFEIAPQLRSVECVNLHPDTFKLPWGSLSKIPIMAVSVEDCIDILRRATRLENGSFIYSNSPSWHLMTSLRHNNLRELAILTAPWNEGVDIHGLFRFLTVPRLQSLRICNVRWPFGPYIVPFLSRIDSLESLHLRRNALSEEDILDILHTSPSLKHLKILSSVSSCTITHNLLDQLVWGPVESVLAPRLETFEFSMYSEMGASFVELLESRWNIEEDSLRVSQLNKVHVITDEVFRGDIMRRLETLVAEGMSITIEKTNKRPDHRED